MIPINLIITVAIISLGIYFFTIFGFWTALGLFFALSMLLVIYRLIFTETGKTVVETIKTVIMIHKMKRKIKNGNDGIK